MKSPSDTHETLYGLQTAGNGHPGEDPDTLLCTICGNPIPEERARLQTATCSEPCKNKLDVIRAHQRASKKCPACLHPSTPEERAEFRAWRVDRGERASIQPDTRDHSMASKYRMRESLKKAATAIRGELQASKAQLEASRPLETKLEPGAEHPGDESKEDRRARRVAEEAQDKLRAKIERFTTLLSEIESLLPSKREAA